MSAAAARQLRRAFMSYGLQVLRISSRVWWRSVGWSKLMSGRGEFKLTPSGCLVQWQEHSRSIARIRTSNHVLFERCSENVLTLLYCRNSSTLSSCPQSRFARDRFSGIWYISQRICLKAPKLTDSFALSFLERFEWGCIRHSHDDGGVNNNTPGEQIRQPLSVL